MAELEHAGGLGRGSRTTDGALRGGAVLGGTTLAVLLFVVPCLLVSSHASGQNVRAEPLYGTFDLTTGFTPKPKSVAVRAGGETDASSLGLVDPTGGPCRGFIAAAQPDVRVRFTAGTSRALRFYVESDADTTLLVNLPDATWRCNDDFEGLGSNPAIMLPAGVVSSGQYDIWVGTYAPGPSESATLFVTEVEAEATSSSPTTSRVLRAPLGAPRVSSFTPSRGPAGTDVTIEGAGLGDTSSVVFGAAAARFVVLSATRIRASVPGGAASGQIRVTTPRGAATSESSFSVAPFIAAFEPRFGLPGTGVVLTGTGFREVTSVRLGEIAARFRVASPERIEMTIPDGARTGTLRVETRSGVAASSVPLEVSEGK